MLSSEFCEGFQKSVFAEDFWMFASDFRQRFKLSVSNSCLGTSKCIEFLVGQNLII